MLTAIEKETVLSGSLYFPFHPTNVVDSNYLIV